MNSKGSSDLMAEAVAAIGPYTAFLARKRAEVRAQIAGMQGAGVAIDPTPTGVMPEMQDMNPSAPETLSVAGSSAAVTGSVAPPVTGDLTTGTLPATATPEGDEPASALFHLNPLSGEAMTVPDLATPPTPDTTVPEGAAPRTVAEAQAALDRVLSTQVVASLPPTLQQAWANRRTDPARWIRLLISADDAEVLPDAVAQAVAGLVEWDTDYRDAFEVFVSGQYPELFEAEWEHEEEEAVGDEANDGEAGRAVERGEEPF